MGKYYRYYYPSIADFARELAEKSHIPYGESVQDRPFYGPDSLEQCIEIAKTGAYIKDLSDKIASDDYTPQTQQKHILTRHVQGSSVSVPAYLAGAPRCMRQATKQQQKRRAITIGVPVSYLASVTHQELIDYAKQIISAIKKLQADRINVKLIVYGWSVDSRGDHFILTIKLKDFNEPINPGALSFVLGHPGFSRRLRFRFAEVYPELKSFCHFMEPQTDVNPATIRVDVAIPPVKHNNPIKTEDILKQCLNN